ncbi:amidohydrolase family protein [Roseateles sp. P5_E4]
MRRQILFTAALLAPLLAFSGGAVSAQGLLVHNARGLTLDEQGRVIRFDAMQVGADGRVLAIGKLNDLPAGDARRIDAGGRVLMPGHRADFILVDRDPLTSSPAALLKTRVLQTWVDGKLVHQTEN